MEVLGQPVPPPRVAMDPRGYASDSRRRAPRHDYQVQKRGNSQGLRLGKALLTDVAIEVGDAVWRSVTVR